MKLRFYDAPQIDFAAVVRQLLNHGASRAEVAMFANVAPPAVDKWLKGAEPKFQNGRALLVLWHERTGRPIDSVLKRRGVTTVSQPAAPVR